MPPDKITSVKNKAVKDTLGLREARERRATGLTIVEGYREILLALEGKAALKEFFYCPDMLSDGDELLKKIQKLHVPCYEVSRMVFEKMAYGDRQEGCLAVVEAKALELNNLTLSANPFFLVVEAVEKPGNLGAMVRIADGVGVDAVIVCDSQSDVYNPNTIRASVGTIFTVKMVVSRQQEAFDFLKSHHIVICAAIPHANLSYTEAKLDTPLAIVVGSEDKGLSDFWLKGADIKVKIPMMGKADSLNVSASSAILLYEALRQRAN